MAALYTFSNAGEDHDGYLVQYGPTKQVFTNPHDQRTEDDITGRFG